MSKRVRLLHDILFGFYLKLTWRVFVLGLIFKWIFIPFLIFFGTLIRHMPTFIVLLCFVFFDIWFNRHRGYGIFVSWKVMFEVNVDGDILKRPFRSSSGVHFLNLSRLHILGQVSVLCGAWGITNHKPDSSFSWSEVKLFPLFCRRLCHWRQDYCRWWLPTKEILAILLLVSLLNLDGLVLKPQLLLMFTRKRIIVHKVKPFLFQTYFRADDVI